jgi:3-methyladenine DNA glycosylase AlkD
VADRRSEAETIGTRLADLVNDPDAFAAALADGLDRLADPEYLAGQQRIAPGIGLVYGVRWPLLAAVARGFRAATRDEPPAPLLFVADRLIHEDRMEPRWFAFGLLERTLDADPERTWQLLRRAARQAGDWVTVDTLARPYARGVQTEAYRWAELEQLVFSPSRWERRLVGSTIATMTHGRRRAGRDPETVRRSLGILGQLMGDADPEVQKSLAWAYRSLAGVDRDSTTAALRHEADRAIADGDGNRAWVVRDALGKLDGAVAEELRASLAGLRRKPGAGPSSDAARIAAGFGSLPGADNLPTAPLASDALVAINVSQESDR